ncbi:HAD-like protein, partial [Microthyrium microscopicum]
MNQSLALAIPRQSGEYRRLADSPFSVRPTRQRLLIVMDLNGTLLERTNFKSNFVPRQNLSSFLAYLLVHHNIMIWSSSKPENVKNMVNQLFPGTQNQLVGVWSRDHLRLTPAQYNSKVQVYKQLSWIWTDPSLSKRHPEGEIWNQTNTVLLDDTALKAITEPHNLCQIPEFKRANVDAEGDVLGQVLAYLVYLSDYDNASAVIKVQPFQ